MYIYIMLITQGEPGLFQEQNMVQLVESWIKLLLRSHATRLPSVFMLVLKPCSISLLKD
jgi:hypothetical protein